MTTRRELLIAAAGALATPLASSAQPQTKIWRVGFLSSRRVDFVDSDMYYGPFRRGMRERGYVEGKNLVIEWRSAEGNNDRLPNLAAELVNLKPDIILAAGTPATRAAQKATATIPIVMGNVGDPEGSGFVKSLARPGGNITGLAQMAGEAMTSKRFEMLLEMVPRLSRVAVLTNPSNTTFDSLTSLHAAAKKRGVKLLGAEVRTPQEIDQAFIRMRQQNVGGVMLVNDGLFQTQKKQVYDLIAKQRLPSIAMNREQADEGMLMSYGVNAPEQYRRAATYVDKIFKGAKPADLPVERPMTLEFVINGKTAKALGLTIPYALRIRATEVIE